MRARVLISGAGIAGCALAWWLHRYGHEVTLVEQASEPRRGGYVIDFWGLGYEVAQKMGLEAELRKSDLRVEEFRIVDRHGRRVTSIDQGALGELTGGRVLSLQRSALALALYRAVEGLVPTRFGDTVTALAQSERGVEVTFGASSPATFDLVVGADGLHSAVRSLAFGAQARFERFLGYCVAAFTVRGYPHRDPHTYVTYGEPGRQVWRITMEDDTTVFLLVFAATEAAVTGLTHDPAGQKEILRRRYAGCGWETDEVLAALETSTDLYFDRVSQIALPHWSEGRIALIGDACACPSLLAGEGSAMAMAEAYTLAGELNDASGHAEAFAAYEGRLRPYVERKQRAARAFASSFVPRSAFGLWARNFVIGAVGRLGLTRLLFKAQLDDRLDLKPYR